jgi:hypothetical protein
MACGYSCKITRGLAYGVRAIIPAMPNFSYAALASKMLDSIVLSA